jgi:hypothetical protein
MLLFICSRVIILIKVCWVQLSLSYGWWSVNQFVLVSGSPLGPMTRFYPYPFFSDNCFVVLPRVPSLTRGRVCNLQCNPWLVRSLRTNNHTLPSHLRLCSLFFTSFTKAWNVCVPQGNLKFQDKSDFCVWTCDRMWFYDVFGCGYWVHTLLIWQVPPDHCGAGVH